VARIAVIGERVRVQGFGLAGALVLVAGDEAAARSAWRDLPGDVGVVILTPAAERALRGAAPINGDRLTAVMPP
jgi:vacuolar-type H+-ATPase subunit F/Vma7